MMNASVLNAALHTPAKALPLHNPIVILNRFLRSLRHGPCQNDNWRLFDDFELVAHFGDAEIRVVRTFDLDKFGCFACWNDHVMQSPSLFSGGFARDGLLLVFGYESLPEMLLVSRLIILVRVFFRLLLLGLLLVIDFASEVLVVNFGFFLYGVG